MTTPTPYDGEVVDREPVVHAARLAGLVAALVVAVLGLIATVIAGRATDLDALTTSLGALFTALAALVAYLSPVWQARKARRLVTPLADPRDDRGEQLMPANQLASPAGTYSVEMTGSTPDELTGDEAGHAIARRLRARHVVRPQMPGEADHAAPES